MVMLSKKTLFDFETIFFLATSLGLVRFCVFPVPTGYRKRKAEIYLHVLPEVLEHSPTFLLFLVIKRFQYFTLLSH